MAYSIHQTCKRDWERAFEAKRGDYEG